MKYQELNAMTCKIWLQSFSIARAKLFENSRAKNYLLALTLYSPFGLLIRICFKKLDTSLVEQVEGTETGGLEPPAKKIRIQHQDGQTYILAVTDNVLAEQLEETDEVGLTVSFTTCYVK